MIDDRKASLIAVGIIVASAIVCSGYIWAPYLLDFN